MTGASGFGQVTGGSETGSGTGASARPDTPEDWLALLKANPDWTERQRSDVLDHLVTRYPMDQLTQAVQSRLDDLAGADGEIVLRLMEALANEEMLRRLAIALMDQPELPLERLADALTLFDGTDILDDFPELREIDEDLRALCDADESDELLDELVQELEDNPEAAALALEDIREFEPDVLNEIVSDLVRRGNAPGNGDGPGPGVVDFLRGVAFHANVGPDSPPHSDETPDVPVEITPDVAVETTPDVAVETAPDVAVETAPDVPVTPIPLPDEEIVPADTTARADIEIKGGLVPVTNAANVFYPVGVIPKPTARARPTVTNAHVGSSGDADETDEESAGRCLVSGVDGDGQGVVLLITGRGATRVSVVFGCDVQIGVRGLIAQEGAEAAEDLYQATQRQAGGVLHDVPELALALLSGSLWIQTHAGQTLATSVAPAFDSGTIHGHAQPPGISPALKRWLDRTVGPGFAPRPFAVAAGIPPAPPRMQASQEMLQSSAIIVLESCPQWCDRSEMTKHLAHEITLRENGRWADPQRNAAIYRYLFERRLHARLDLYRGMLAWLAAFQRARNDTRRANAALLLARHLADPQFAVPHHPFLTRLTTLSLRAAQEEIAAAKRQAGPFPPGF